jgi:hypothetical protein
VTTTTATTTSMTTTSGPLSGAHFRLYIRIGIASGGVRDADVPFRSIEPPLADRHPARAPRRLPRRRPGAGRRDRRARRRYARPPRERRDDVREGASDRLSAPSPDRSRCGGRSVCPDQWRRRTVVTSSRASSCSRRDARGRGTTRRRSCRRPRCRTGARRTSRSPSRP